MNTSSLTPFALITPVLHSPQTTNMLQALKRLFNICRGACSIYVESVHKSHYVRRPGNPIVEFVKVGIQPADFNPLRQPRILTLLVFAIHRATPDCPLIKTFEYSCLYPCLMTLPTRLQIQPPSI